MSEQNDYQPRRTRQQSRSGDARNSRASREQHSYRSNRSERYQESRSSRSSSARAERREDAREDARFERAQRQSWSQSQSRQASQRQAGQWGTAAQDANGQRRSAQSAAARTQRMAASSAASARPARPSGRATQDARTTQSARGSQAGRVPQSRSAQGNRTAPSRSQARAGAAARPQVQQKRKGGKWKIALVAVLAVMLIGAGAAFAYYQTLQSNLHEGLDEEDLSKYLVETDLTNEPFYMLLMGTDGSSEREADESFGNSFRTDSIILARIDPVEKKAALVSIHRDSEVDMGEYGAQKINAAHAFGGASLSVKTVSEMAGVDISHYAEINFDGFKEIIDALGGVEVDVPLEIDDEDAGGHLDAGLQTLNGDQALILCRSRNTYANAADPDSMRAANQRLVLSAIANKVLSSDVATIANSVTAISKYVTTDLEVSDIIGLAQAMRGMDTTTDLYTAMEPVTSEYANETWYTYTDQEAWKEMIARMDAGLPPAESTEVDESTGTIISTSGTAADKSQRSATVSVKNGTDVDGRAETVVQLLQDAGFANTTGENAALTDYDETLVIYRLSTYADEAQEIVEALGQGRAIQDNNEWLFETDFLVVIGNDWTDSSE